MRKSLALVLLCSTLFACAGVRPSSPRASETAATWLEIQGEQRTRYESFDEQFRAGGTGSGQGVFTRTSVRATARSGGLEGSVELLDSRQFDTPDDLPLDTGVVNTLDLLQTFVRARVSEVWRPDDELTITAGRQTLDVGSRRLVARNRFRNTINAFTGVHADWEDSSGSRIRAFWVLPVQRLPRDADSLRDNEQEFDEERTQVRFLGLHASSERLPGSLVGELYAFHLDEEDGDELATRNRDLWTVGARCVKPPAAGEFDLDLEAAYQTGTSRASGSAADTTDLDHRAEFLHLSAGYRWDVQSAPRLEALFDYASGDDRPGDGDWNRFDTLFGARRFELGPTGIFGAFARSNLLSPGLRLTLEPAEDVQLMFTDRFHYLASDRDAWTTSGLVDPSGGSGDYVGNLAEVRLRWEPRAGLRLEVGAAHLFTGGFAEEASGASPAEDSTYAYVSTTLSF